MLLDRPGRREAARGGHGAVMAVRCGREATLRKKGNPKQSNRSGSLSRCLNLGLSRAAEVGGWGAARPAQLRDFRACPLRIQLPLGVAKTIRSYHHLRASSYQSASDIRRAKRQGSKKSRPARWRQGRYPRWWPAVFPPTRAIQTTVSPRPGQYALPFIPARAAAPAAWRSSPPSAALGL